MKTESDAEKQFEQDTLAHDDRILICDQHKLTQQFSKGTKWGEIDAVVEKHKRDFHGAANAEITRVPPPHVCPNCNQVKSGHAGVWPCEVCGEPVKWPDGSQLNWQGTAAEVAAHQKIHDDNLHCAICAGSPETRTRG
jgi:ribosomal protein L37AE/L43A